ncbi:MAG: prenyltransferase [Bdellovibrionota bacterium]
MEQALAVRSSFIGSFAHWVRAVRAYSFSASLVPVFLGTSLAASGSALRWDLFAWIVLSILAMHAGTNLVNDYYDYDLGLDDESAPGASGLVAVGELSARQVGRAAAASFVLAVLFGIPLVIARGWPIVLLGVLGTLGGALYTAKPVQYKYFGAGDFLVFLLLGPLAVAGTYFTLTGEWATAPLIASIPVGLLVVAILHANNLRDFDIDREFELKTLAIRMGRQGSVWYLWGLAGASYLVLAASLALGILPWEGALGFLSLPAVVRLAWAARPFGHSGSRPGADIVRLAGIVHVLFGALLAAGIFWAGK